MVVKFPTPQGVAALRGDVKVARQCYVASIKIAEKAQVLALDDLEPRESVKKCAVEPGVEVEEIQLDQGAPEKTVKIGSGLVSWLKSHLINLLTEFIDVFAWSPSDMPGIPRDIIEHKLGVDPGHKPVRQKKRAFGTEKSQIIDSEVDKLLQVNIVREVEYPIWLANPVLVKKPNGEWRMCVDFTSLNEACPKDFFPLPRIDILVDSIAGFRFMCFLDAYRGYHQIFLRKEDEEKTAFVTDKGTYCYVTMPFGLKNAGATYQRLVNKVFKDQIGRNMEAYIDDMLVKSIDEHALLADLREVFVILIATRMRLNPKKWGHLGKISWLHGVRRRHLGKSGEGDGFVEYSGTQVGQ